MGNEAEIRSAEEALAGDISGFLTRPFHRDWGVEPWLKWATISSAISRIGIASGSSVLDVGCGTGWTSAFLAESGYRVVGLDVAPAALEIARRRASRWQFDLEFVAADMQSFDLDTRFDLVVVNDALHHVEDPAAAVAQVAAHLSPGGWALFGEPSVLHYLSPHAREERAHGWTERGISVRKLQRWCRRSGLRNGRRFFQPSAPYERRVSEFVDRIVRLVAANVAFAPNTAVWFAAQKPS